MVVVHYCCGILCVSFFFFKQKTAYEMRISDWSSDVCSSDLVQHAAEHLIGCYRDGDPDFIAHTSLREDIGPGLMVSGRNLLISTATRMQRRRVDALLQHEVSIHLLTFINGDAQGDRKSTRLNSSH